MPIGRRTRIALAVLATLVLCVGSGIAYIVLFPAPLEGWLQARILVALRQHYRGEVQLQSLHVTLAVPRFHASADDFVLPNNSSSDRTLPPFITVKHLTVEGNLLELLGTPVHVTWVKLDGLQISVPPKGARKASGKPQHHTHLANFVIDKVDADGAKLDVLRKNPQIAPMEFTIRKLTLHSAGVGQPMKFQAELTNPKPPGDIATTGRFGPWNFDDPAATALGGHYVFQHADLSVFSGISGTLSSIGDYSGVLRNLTVDGSTDTPDFQLDRGGREVHLSTRFHASVDAGNGNTYLQPVEAHFLDSTVVTQGEVAGRPGEKGKTVKLDIDIDDACVQDVLALASKASPPSLTGHLRMKAKLELPPGKSPVLQRMLSQGTFTVSGVQFSNERIRTAIAELSKRGRGNPQSPTPNQVPGQFAGDYQLRTTKLNFTRLQFTVPGAAVAMRGAYGLRSRELNFAGAVQLQARVSQMVTGPAHWVLVPLDPIFMRNGAGTYVPVSVSGTREHPQVKVEWKKIFQ